MGNWREIGREIGIVILFAAPLVFVSFVVSWYTAWHYRQELGVLRVEKAFLMAVITYQAMLGVFLYRKLSSLVVRGPEYILFYSWPIILYMIFNYFSVWVFFGILYVIALATIYRIRSLERTSHDFRKTERWEHGEVTLSRYRR